MKIRLVCLVLLAALSGCRSGLFGMTYTPDDPEGVVLMRVPSGSSDYILGITNFDPALGPDAKYAGEGASFASVNANAEGYLVRKAAPGRYIVRSVLSQGHWAACFHAETVAFDVRAGEVTYLGEFDPAWHIAQIGTEAAKRNELAAQGSQIRYYFDGIVAPKLSPPQPETLAAAKDFVARAMTNTTAPVVAADYEPATFARGQNTDRGYGDAFHAVCGSF